jgi:hypothetical protein
MASQPDRIWLLKAGSRRRLLRIQRFCESHGAALPSGIFQVVYPRIQILTPADRDRAERVVVGEFTFDFDKRDLWCRPDDGPEVAYIATLLARGRLNEREYRTMLETARDFEPPNDGGRDEVGR